MPGPWAGAGEGEFEAEEMVELVLRVVGGDLEEAGDIAEAFT